MARSNINIHKFPQMDVLQYFRGPIILFLAALLLVVMTLLVTIRVQRVSGTEVGVKVNNLSGEITVITSSGTQIYNGLLNSFHLLDATVQRLEMTADPSRGDRPKRDDLRIKTIDGSDVNVDITIMAEEPRLSAYITAMRETLAPLLGISPDAVGVKATTTEQLGFVGRAEGIEAHAVCLLRGG